MKILIFSDTHGRTDKMREIISRSRLSAELVIHLGDCYTDLVDIRNDFPTVAMLTVRGNCDFGFLASDAPDSSTVTLEGHTIFYTHGSRYLVQNGVDALVYAAAERKADIALFGHTHVGYEAVVDGVHVFNPGSLERPRDTTNGTYGILELTKDRVCFTRKEYL